MTIGLSQGTEHKMRQRHIIVWILLALMSAGCTLVGEVVPLTPTPALPSVSFRYPENNAQVYENTDLTIELLATDNVLGISRIDLYIDTLPDDSQPYNSASPVEADTVPAFAVNMNWLAQNTGRHTLTAIAYRADGLQSDETTIVIEVLERDGDTTNTE